ncbi:MAG TPA: insulinase family protein, partial [Anaeromyxobacter sp.]|nr:insulinase family protein [Anaeromyxobacter sp.]
TGERDPISVLDRQARAQLGVSFEAYYRTTLTPDRAVSVSVLPDGTAPPTTAPLDEPGAWIPVVATLGAAAPGAAEVLEVVEPAAFDRAFRTRLANGLQVVVMPHGELPIVEARLLVDADPGEGRGGDLVPVVALALSKKAWTLAESYGCAQSPALVWREKVSFRERGPTARLPEMLDRLACWTRRSLDGDRVDHLREAAGKAGPSAGLSPSATAWAALRSAIYSPDGELLEGARLHAVQPSSAERWLREQLRPERSLLVLAGKVSPTPELLAQLERRFAAWKAFGPAPREHAPPALPARRRVVLVDVPGAERVTLGVAARLPRRAEADEAATLALAQVLSLRLRAAAGPASDVFMNVGGLAHAPFLSAWATVSAKHAPNAITAALDSLREVSAEPLGSVDANLVRWLVARWQSFRFDTVGGRSEGVEQLFFADLPLDAWERLPASIAALTPERIRAAAQATAVGREVVVVQGDAATLAPALRDAGLSPEVLPAPQPAR